MRLTPETAAALGQLVDEAVESVRQASFASFLRLQADPLGCRAEALAAEKVGARLKAMFGDLTDG
jgi:hypothetical protein